MSVCEGKYSDSTVTTGVSIRQLGSCKTSDQCYCYYNDRHCNNDRDSQFQIPSRMFEYKMRFYNYCREFKFQIAGSDREYNS